MKTFARLEKFFSGSITLALCGLFVATACSSSQFASSAKRAKKDENTAPVSSAKPGIEENDTKANKALEDALNKNNTDSTAKAGGASGSKPATEVIDGSNAGSGNGNGSAGQNLGLELTENFSGPLLAKKKIMVVAAIDTSGSMQRIVENSMNEIARIAKNVLEASSQNKFIIVGSDQEVASGNTNASPVKLGVPASLAGLNGFKNENTFVDSCDALGELAKSLRAKGSTLLQFDALHLITVTNDNAGPGNEDPTFCFGNMKDPATAIHAQSFANQLNSIKTFLPAAVSFHHFSFRGNVKGLCADAAGFTGTRNEFVDSGEGKWRRGFEYEKLASLFPWTKHTTGDVCTNNWQAEFSAPEEVIKDGLSTTLNTAKPIVSLTRVSVNGAEIPLANTSFAGNTLQIKQSLPEGSQISVTYRSAQ